MASCQYLVPAVPIPNVFVNPEDVIVYYYPGSGTAPIALTRSNDGCGSGEWMYNDDQTMLLLCDSTCTTVKNDPGAKIEVYFGCIAPQ